MMNTAVILELDKFHTCGCAVSEIAALLASSCGNVSAYLRLKLDLDLPNVDLSSESHPQATTPAQH